MLQQLLFKEGFICNRKENFIARIIRSNDFASTVCYFKIIVIIHSQTFPTFLPVYFSFGSSPNSENVNRVFCPVWIAQNQSLIMTVFSFAVLHTWKKINLRIGMNNVEHILGKLLDQILQNLYFPDFIFVVKEDFFVSF